MSDGLVSVIQTQLRRLRQQLEALEGTFWNLFQPQLVFVLGRPVEQTQPFPEEFQMAVLQMSNSQKCLVRLAPKKASGQPARLDGIPTWETSDPTTATVSATTSDGLEAQVVASGPLGACQIIARGDADLGSGVRPIVGVLDVEINEGEAVVLELEPGTPEEQ